MVSFVLVEVLLDSVWGGIRRLPQRERCLKAALQRKVSSMTSELVLAFRSASRSCFEISLRLCVSCGVLCHVGCRYSAAVVVLFFFFMSLVSLVIVHAVA